HRAPRGHVHETRCVAPRAPRRAGWRHPSGLRPPVPSRARATEARNATKAPPYGELGRFGRLPRGSYLPAVRLPRERADWNRVATTGDLDGVVAGGHRPGGDEFDRADGTRPGGAPHRTAFV